MGSAFLTLAFVLLVPGVIAIVVLASGRDRWGAGRITVARGDGAYRAGGVGVPAPRPVPASVRVATLASWLWGGITMLLFVPLGALVVVVTGERRTGADTVVVLIVILLVLSALAHSLSLFVAGTRVARHHPRAASTARSAAVLARWHHGAMLVGMTFCGLSQHVVLALGLLVVGLLPCAIGALVGVALDAAADRITSIDREDASERHRQLFAPAPS